MTSPFSSQNRPSRGGAVARPRFSTALLAVIVCIALAFSGVIGVTAVSGFGSSARTEAFAAPSVAPEAEGLFIGTDDAGNQTVKAGVFAFDGYHMMNDEGELYGYGIEVLEMISKYSRLNFDLVGFESSWSEMLEMLESGEIDVVTSASKTPEREAKFDYSLPIGKKSTVLSVDVDDTHFISGNYATYNGIVVGEIPGSTMNDQFAEFANEKGFGYTVVEFQDDTEMVEALQDGKVDAILTSDLRKRSNEKTLEVIEDDNYYAIVRKGETHLLDEINYAIEQMNLSEGDWKNTLYYQYYGPEYSHELEFTAREQAYIDDVKAGKKSIRAIALADRRPYSYVEDGALTGIIIDYFAAVMDVAGLPYEVVVPESLEQYEDMIKNEEVNVVLDAMTGDYTKEHYFDNSFNSDVFMTASVVQVTRTDFSGPIRSIAVADTYTQALAEFLAEEDDVEMIFFPSRQDAMKAVLDGKADCAYVYVYTAQEFINHDITSSLTYNTIYGLDVEFDMRVSAHNDHELVSILNKCIKQVPESVLAGLAADYTSYNVSDLSFLELLQANPSIIGFAAVLALIVVAIILFLVLRGRWNERLLATQEKSNQELQEQLSIVEALSHDYTNVFSVDAKHGTAKIVKLEGYVTPGMKKDTEADQDYTTLLSTYINTRVHPDDREQLTKELALDNVRKHIRSDHEFVGTYRVEEDGEIHNYQYTYVLVEDESQNQSLLLIGFRNIDEVVRKEQEQKEVLSEALAQAQYANQAKTTFLNSMSHDIRTPMNAIIGFTALAGTHIDNTDQVQNYLNKIMTSSNHLLSLINDVLDMSRIESGKVKIDNKETNLPEVMHDLRTIVQADVRAKDLELFFDMLDVTDETVICDKLRLNQVLLNILSNAIKYTEPGGSVSVRIVESDYNPQDGTAAYRFVVKDTGIGMSPEFLEHVFEPFERAETATVSGIQGTGLGLAITKNIIDLMNGDVQVTSVEGEGSEFTVDFRFKVPENVEKFVPPEVLNDLRALVVDDDMDTCTSISRMLLTIGMRPDWTTRPDEAITHTTFAQEQNDPYSAYIIDWVMPSMSGLDLVRRIRKIIGDETPIIVATAYDWTEIEEEAREAGVTAICSKPLFLSELRDVLMRPFVEGVDADSDDVIVANDAPTATANIKNAFDVAADRLKGMHILLAEDNMMSREIAVTILEDVDIVVDAVEDGKFAVERMEEMPAGTYDVVLTDVQMPIMNGYETARAIRALEDPEKANIPIIAVTANAFDEDREEAIASGMSGYVPKPIDIPRLFEALQEIFGEN